MPTYMFKCVWCGKVQTVERTVNPDNKIVKPYNPQEPCGFCGKPMIRVFTEPYVSGDTVVKEQ